MKTTEKLETMEPDFPRSYAANDLKPAERRYLQMLVSPDAKDLIALAKDTQAATVLNVKELQRLARHTNTAVSAALAGNKVAAEKMRMALR